MVTNKWSRKQQICLKSHCVGVFSCVRALIDHVRKKGEHNYNYQFKPRRLPLQLNMYGCGKQVVIRASQHWKYGLRRNVYFNSHTLVLILAHTHTFLLDWRDLRRFQMTDEMLSKISFILSFFFPAVIHSLFLLQYIIHQKKKSWSKGSLRHVRVARHTP